MLMTCDLLTGLDNGNMVDFEGTALQMPGVSFKIAQGFDIGGTDGNALSRGNAQSRAGSQAVG
jgi:hypothetical protein